MEPGYTRALLCFCQVRPGRWISRTWPRVCWKSRGWGKSTISGCGPCPWTKSPWRCTSLSVCRYQFSLSLLSLSLSLSLSLMPSLNLFTYTSTSSRCLRLFLIWQSSISLINCVKLSFFYYHCIIIFLLEIKFWTKFYRVLEYTFHEDNNCWFIFLS